MRTDLISPSPNAASLSKYGDLPVTYYTGLPNVSIPIFTVTGNELSLPISLSYNHSGLRPTEQCGFAGLGWSIQAGGVITRTVNDKLDPMGSYDRATAQNLGSTQQYRMQSYLYGTYDNLPDVYNFNFGNYSGRFIMYDGVPYLMSDQDVKITKEVGSAFVIVTEDGTRYKFSGYEQTSLRADAGSPYTIPTYTSAFYLTEITNAAGNESIYLDYVGDGTVSQYGQQTQSFKKSFNLNSSADQPGPLSTVFPTKVTSFRLSSITSEKFRVDFESGGMRQDLQMVSGVAQRLGVIKVYYRDELIKNFKLNHSYFEGNKFLKLESIEEAGSLPGSRFMKHSFSYYEGSFGEGATSMVDKYGYSLGGGIGGTIISKEYYKFGTDRTPQLIHTVAGALQKITYPTGGSTTFTYEPNRYYVYDSQPYIVLPQEVPGGADVNSRIYDNTFELLKDVNVTVKIIRGPEPGEVETPHNNPDDFEIRLAHYDAHGNLDYIEGVVLASGAVTLPGDTGNVAYRTFFLEANTSSNGLANTKYVIRGICDQDESFIQLFVNWDYITDELKPGELGPGIRLKELDHDNGFGKTLKKQFRYVDEAGFCSGAILQTNNYNVRSYTENLYDSGLAVPGIPDEIKEYLMITAMIAETSGAGLPMYYKRVLEETVSGGEVHRADYNYYYFDQSRGVELMSQNEFVYRDSIFVPLSKAENVYGEQILTGFGGQEIYVEAVDLYFPYTHPVEIYGSEYKIQPVAFKYPHSTRQTRYENGQALTTDTRYYYDVGDRYVRAMKQTLADGATLYTRYKYPFDYSATVMGHHKDAHWHVVIEEQVWRKEISGDSVMISGRINEYSGKRLMAIHVLESVNGITALDNQTVSSGKFNTLISDTRFKKKVEFWYDAAGRVIQQQLTDHPAVAYIWGYEPDYSSGSETPGKIFPIAEVKNAEASSVFHTSFEEIGLSDENAFTGRKVKADSFKIKKNLTGSYVLTYWKKTGTNPWQLISQTLTNPNNYIISAAGSRIDEVRLYPSSAQMTTYTYKIGIGISSICDPNNSVVYYSYDPVGRLIAVKDHKGNIITNHQYHVKDQHIAILMD